MQVRVGIAVLALFIFGYGGSAAGAPISEVVQQDLAPANGVVVAVEGNGEIILDLTAGDGLTPGDLVSVLGEGKPLIHPVTEEVIGTLEAAKAVLSVYRVREGFSHARPVQPPEAPIRRGDSVRRFGEMPVRFWDYTGEGAPLFRRLRAALPTLKWGDYEADQAVRPEPPAPPEEWNGLLLLLRDGVLEVRDPDFQPLYRYRLSANEAASAPSPPTEATVSRSAPAAAAVPTESEGRSGLFSADFGGMQRHGVLPGGTTTMAVFLPYEGQLLMAAATENRLRVLGVGAELRPLATADVAMDQTIFAVQWWQPDAAEGPYVAVTAYGDEEMASAVFAFDGAALRRVQGFIPAILGTLDRDGDGRRETLLRQSFDRDTFWGTRVRQLTLAADGLADGPAPAALPRGFTAVGSRMADLTGNGRPELAVVRGQTLEIYDDGDPLFRTPGMGGSLARIVYALNPDQQDVLTRGETLEIDPVAADLDGDGVPELLAPASSQSSVTVANIYSGFKSTQLAVFSYRDGTFVKGRLGEEMDHPVQGLGLHGGRVYLVTSQLGNLLGQGGESRLLSFRLAD